MKQREGTIVYLDAKDKRYFEKIAAEEGISTSAVMRRVLMREARKK